MAKTQDELNQLKTEYETLNNKLKELSDDELKTVVGGTDYYMGYEFVALGNWYTTPIYPDHILKVISKSVTQTLGNNQSSTGAIFAKYWYDGVNAWNHGTCTSVGLEKYCLKNPPTNIYDKYTVEKPFK